MIVVDTYVIAYFVYQSEFTSLAESVIRKDHEWAAPALWRSEFRNVLLKQIRTKNLDLIGALVKFKDAELMIGDREYEIDSARVLELAVASGCTAYDCEFVSLAEALRVPLVTSDKKILEAFPDIALGMEKFAAPNHR